MSQLLVPRQLYYRVFIALLGLTLLTVAVAFVDLGPLNTVIALTIALTKTLLVILYFMHLRYSSGLTWIVLGAGMFWLILLLTITLSDYLTRDWLPVTGW